MDALETIKQELILQKAAIEEKGGKVAVVNDFPSPSEITAGIKTVTGKDMSDATATETDVLKGKTYYAGDATLRMGTLEVVDHSKLINDVVFTQDTTSTTEFTFHLGAGLKFVRKYACYYSKAYLTLYFNEEVETIGEHAFDGCSNFKFPNVFDLTNLLKIENYGFQSCKKDQFDLSAVPTSLTYLGQCAFYNLVKPGETIRVPPNLTKMNPYTFAASSKSYPYGVIFHEGFSMETLPERMFQNLVFETDFTVPSSVKTINTAFVYGGGFRSFTIPATCTTINSLCFGASNSDSASVFTFRTLIFESETPPTIGSNLIAKQHLANGLKIYVPDNAIEAYKTTTNLTAYADYFYPMSQKE